MVNPFDGTGSPGHGASEDPPPPAREQLPLPRRRQQGHLEPQLRERSGRGSGTPFAAFTTDPPAGGGDAGDQATERHPDQGGHRTPDPAAAFRAATRRGRRPSPRPRRPRT